MKATLNKPADGHTPRLGRRQIGKTPTRPTRPLYGTTLACSCGWRPRRPVSNEAPSAGGRASAQAEYARHVRRSVAGAARGVPQPIINALMDVADRGGFTRNNDHIVGVEEARQLIDAGYAAFESYEEVQSQWSDSPARYWHLLLTDTGRDLAATIDSDPAE